MERIAIRSVEDVIRDLSGDKSLRITQEGSIYDIRRSFPVPADTPEGIRGFITQCRVSTPVAVVEPRKVGGVGYIIIDPSSILDETRAEFRRVADYVRDIFDKYALEEPS